jgi:hypothetical protein
LGDQLRGIDAKLTIDSGAVIEPLGKSLPEDEGPQIEISSNGELLVTDAGDPSNPPVIELDILNRGRFSYRGGDLSAVTLTNAAFADDLVLDTTRTLTLTKLINQQDVVVTNGHTLKCTGEAGSLDGIVNDNAFSGELIVAEGQLEFGPDKRLLNRGGSVYVDGNVLGDVRNEDRLVAGSPLRPTGTCLITGDYAAGPESVTEFALADIAAGPASQMLLFGEAGLDGVLRVTFPEGFPALSEGESFTLISALSRDGTFGGFDLAPGYRWQVAYVGGEVILTVGERTGDLNCDGVVDFFDIDPFVTVLVDPAGYATAYPSCDPQQGDIDDDGFVNFFDIDPFVELLLSF